MRYVALRCGAVWRRSTPHGAARHSNAMQRTRTQSIYGYASCIIATTCGAVQYTLCSGFNIIFNFNAILCNVHINNSFNKIVLRNMHNYTCIITWSQVSTVSLFKCGIVNNNTDINMHDKDDNKTTLLKTRNVPLVMAQRPTNV